MGGLASGFYNLFKQGSKRFGNYIDNFWLDAEARKAIEDEVGKKFQPKIDRFNTAASRRATSITELDKKLAESKKALQDAKDKWQRDYDAALATAKNQRQTEINDYDTQLQAYKDALDQANKGRQDIVDQLYDQEAKVDQSRTLFIDVNTGDRYIFNPRNGKYDKLETYYQRLNTKDQRKLDNRIQNYETRLFDPNSGDKIINAFDKSSAAYKTNVFNNYYLSRINTQNAALRDADRQIKQASDDLNKWSANTRPKDWDDTPNSTDIKQFESNFTGKNGKSPSEYSFNGKTYGSKTDLDQAYQDALSAQQARKDLYSKVASGYVSKRDAEIAQRIQDAKDINKAKVALGLGTAGALAGATYAAFSGDDNSNTKPVSPIVTPQTTEGIETQFEHPAETDSISGISPRDQEAALADMAFKAASESDDTSAETHPETPELAELSADDIHTNEGIGTRRSMNEGLFSVIKALQDPHQANAVADYIYSRYGNDPELQQLGWRAWLNKYYGDALRSQMNLDASGYNGMHIA